MLTPLGSIWITLSWLVLLTTAHATSFDCTQLKAKKFVLCGKAIVQADIHLDIKKSLTTIYPESKIISGDLDHDGINDFVVYATEQTSVGMTDRVVVLKGKSGGGYEDFAKSSVIQYGTANIEIKNQSLYIQVDHNSINESHTKIYQFKYRAGGIFLIGEEERSYVPVDENHGSESITSTNHLTGKVIETEKTNGNVTRETKEKGVRKLLRLEEFTR